MVDTLIDRLRYASNRVGMGKPAAGLESLLDEAADLIEALAAAPTPSDAVYDGCTESNCRRCLTEPYARGNMEHAGIGSRPQADPARTYAQRGKEMKTVYVSTLDFDEELNMLMGMGVEQFAVVWDNTESKWAISYQEE